MQEEEYAVRCWQAKWLFAVPLLQLALLVVLNSDLFAQMAAAGTLCSAVLNSTTPALEGCLESVQSWWQAAGALLASARLLAPEVGADLLAGVAAALLAGVLLFKAENNHA
jgi:hypothetical protein